MEAVPAQRSIVRRRGARDATQRRARHDTDFAARFSRISETPANWAFLLCLKIRAQPAMPRLTSSAATRRGCLAVPPSATFAAKKNSAKISPEGRSDAHRTRAKECKGCESVLSDSQNRVFGSVWQAA